MTKVEFQKLKSEVIYLLQTRLKKEYYYHSVDHTLDVLDKVEMISVKEGCSEKDQLLLRIAVLFHDAGFITGKNQHEKESCLIARKVLEKYSVTDSDVEKICKLIMSTDISRKPTNKLSKILCDADLDYLGRNDFEEIADKLFMEMKAKKVLKNKNEWNQQQVKFIKQHKYYTSASRKLRDKKKKENLLKIEKQIKQ